MVNYPLISIIVPTIGRDTLERTIESIINSKYPNLEILISANNIDLFVIKKKLDYPNVNLVAFTNKKINPATAKNKALIYAKGKYITFLDDDDTCLPEKFFTLSGFLENHQEIFGVFGQYNVRDCYSGKIKNTNCGGCDRVGFDTLLQSNYIGSGSIMLRNTKDIYFDESIDFGEDWMMNLRLISKYKFHFIKTVVYAWTQNLESGFTARYNKAKINWKKIVENNRQKAIKLWKSTQ